MFLGSGGRHHWFGRILDQLNIQIMGTVTGIVCVLTFVGLPFYINAVKTGFEAVPARLETVSRSLGASPWSTYFRITLPLAWRSMLVGLIMCMARAVSEFGAIANAIYDACGVRVTELPITAEKILAGIKAQRDAIGAGSGSHVKS